jgi:hypothetical protein
MLIKSEALRNAKQIIVGVNLDKNKYYPIVDEFDGHNVTIKTDLFELKFSNNEKGLTYAELFYYLKGMLTNIYEFNDYATGFQVECTLTDKPIVLLPMLTGISESEQTWKLALVKNNTLSYPFKYDIELNYKVQQREIFEKLCHANHLDKEL